MWARTIIHRDHAEADKDTICGLNAALSDLIQNALAFAEAVELFSESTVEAWRSTTSEDKIAALRKAAARSHIAGRDAVMQIAHLREAINSADTWVSRLGAQRFSIDNGLRKSARFICADASITD